MIKEIKEKIQEKLRQALRKLGVKEEPTIEVPANPDFGDYSSSIALKLTNILKKNPLQIAQEIVKNLPKDETIEKVEVIKPGFVNFWLSKKYLIKKLKDINDNFGKSDSLKNKKIMIEFTDPNPFKEFHIGHLYSNIVGESLSRLHESLGADVKRVCYQGDVGMHVAKSIWGMIKKIKEEKMNIKNLDNLSLSEKAKFMGKAYALGATAFEENESSKKEITKLNKKIYALDPEIKELYENGRRWTLDYFETIYKRLGTKFDFYYFEREVGEKGLAFVKENLKKDIFQESQGAIIFDGKKYGLHTRVFVNSQGLPTYEAKDLGLAPTKFADFPYDLSIIVTGSEINDYFKVVLKALELINPNLRKKTVHISHGMIKIPEGKMSSRSGNVITGEWLLDETKKLLKKIVEEGKKVNISKVEDVSEIIAVGAIKYSLLKTNIGSNVIFDFNETLSFEGNSGPYLQYTFTRCQSVINQSKIHVRSIDLSTNIQINREESELLRIFSKYPETVLNTASNLSPHILCGYLFDLAQKFNLFYQKCPILKVDEEIKNFRLLLTQATAQILKNGLNLLGIKTVDQM